MKRMTVVFVALVFALVSVGTVYAHQRRGGRGGEGWEKGFGLARLADKLDLSSEQKRQVASILESHRMEIGAVANQLADATDGLMSAVGAEEFPEGAVSQAAHAVALQHEKFIMLRARIMNEIKGILTPAQAATLQAIKDERTERMKDHIERRLGALDKWIAEHTK